MIEARGLSKRYGQTMAVSELSFDVPPGRVTGFLGPNGSGKSTTMRMIMGLDFPTSGEVRVNHKRYHELAWPLREVGALLEAKAIHPGRSAYNHLAMLAQTNQIPMSRVEEVIDLVGLTSVATKRVKKFSLGMGQRLGIAAALLGDPATLLFDEPINGLDPEGIRWVRNLLRGLAAQGRTVFVSSHLMSEMALTADHVVVIGRGRLIANTSMADFVERSSSTSCRVRTPATQALGNALYSQGARVSLAADGSLEVTGMPASRIGEIALAIGVPLHELTPQRASLEDVFMQLTEGSLDFKGSGVGQR